MHQFSIALVSHSFDRSNFSNVIGMSQNIAAIQKDTRRYRRYEARYVQSLRANIKRDPRENKQKTTARVGVRARVK